MMLSKLNRRILADRLLRWGLVFVGIAGVAAIIPTLMPAAWFIAASTSIGIEFPGPVLGFFLARQLSLLYVMVGCSLLVIARDVSRYEPLLSSLVYFLLVAGSVQIWIDYQVGLPVWWTAIEGTRTIIGGFILAILLRIRRVQR